MSSCDSEFVLFEVYRDEKDKGYCGSSHRI